MSIFFCFPSKAFLTGKFHIAEMVRGRLCWWSGLDRLPHRWNDLKAAGGIPEGKLLPAGLETMLESPTSHQSSLGPSTKHQSPGGVWVKVVACQHPLLPELIHSLEQRARPSVTRQSGEGGCPDTHLHPKLRGGLLSYRGPAS